MKIYVSHSTNFDYQSDLYSPLQRAFGGKHELVLPHNNKEGEHSKSIINSCDVVLAEASYPSTGQGIELGWADSSHVPIVCIYRSSEVPSGALRHIARNIVGYENENEMLDKLAQLLK